MANWSKKDYYQASESENEEEVAIEKLKERTQLMDEKDFLPDFEDQEINYDMLTEDELLEVIQRDSPELLEVLGSVKKLVKAYKAAKHTQNFRVLKYCKLLALHISFYILLKSKGKVAANHPVVGAIKNIENIILNTEEIIEKTEENEEIEEIAEKNRKNEEKTENKRVVDEKIKQNKGIVKKRKKIERNVRVKNKMKYLKKVKIRRSTLGISEPRNQERYEGEATGIRKNLVKSTKLS